MLDHLTVDVMIELVIVANVAVQPGYHSGEGKVFVNAHVSGSQLFDLGTSVCQTVFGVENCRFVHVVPETVNALFCQNGIFFAEPVSCLRLEEIREVYPTRPYCAHKIAAFCIFAEVVFLHALFINAVAVLDLDTGINDGNQMDALCLHIGSQSLQIRETLFIHGEVLVALHVVDVQIDAVQGNAGSLVLCSDFPDICLIFITPAALSVAECPERRNIASADDPTELLDDILFIFTGDDIDGEVIFRRLDLHGVSPGIADVELHLSGIIEKCTESDLAADNDKIVRAVERTGVLVVVGVVIVPADILPATLVDAPDLFAQTVYNVVFRKRIGKTALVVRFEKRQGFFGGLDLLYHSVGGEWVSVYIFLNHNSTSFQKVIAFFLSI